VGGDSVSKMARGSVLRSAQKINLKTKIVENDFHQFTVEEN
jgi:hypothetical protein